jgi:ketosteroid isomerase-like protein
MSDDDFLTRLEEACSSHDPARVAALFAEDYRSSMPAHPGREFVGRAQVLTNWTAVFDGVPDFTAHLITGTIDGDLTWGEWEWTGTHTDGSPFAMRGVSILRLRDGLIAEGRLYLEPVAEEESTIDEAVEELYQP